MLPPNFWRELRGLLERIACLIDESQPTPAQPELLDVEEVIEMSKKMRARFNSPEATSSEVDRYKVKATVDGVELPLREYPIGQPTDKIEGPPGATLTIAYAEMDTDGETGAYGPEATYQFPQNLAPPAPTGAPVLLDVEEFDDSVTGPNPEV